MNAVYTLANLWVSHGADVWGDDVTGSCGTGAQSEELRKQQGPFLLRRHIPTDSCLFTTNFMQRLFIISSGWCYGKAQLADHQSLKGQNNTGPD